MLSLLLIHIIITFICLWAGFLFYNSLVKATEEKHICFYAITGLIILTLISQIAVLFIPLNIYCQFSVLLLFVISIISNWQKFVKFISYVINEITALSLLSKGLLAGMWLIILLINSGPTMMDDTESYHIQSIKWIQEFGTVPGLVNLHERFGFNSSWFSSIALFSFSSKTTGGFTVLNGILSMWLCIWLISKYNQFQKENNVQAAFAILIIFIGALVIWPLIRGNAATANYDFIATAVVSILFIEIFFSPGDRISPSIEWIIWPVYLFTVRVINFPLLLLSLIALIFFINQKKLKAMILPFAYCLLLIISFVIRNFIIAGYLFYPATYFDWFNADWKPDPQMTEKLLEYIKYYNRVNTTYLDIEQTKALGSSWIPVWFQHLFLFDKILVVLGLAGILFTITKSFSSKNNYRNKAGVLISISIVSLICWLLISPDPRFIYGILLFGIFLFAYNLISLIRSPGPITILSYILILLLIAGTPFYLISKLWRQKEYRNWIVPAQFPQPPVKEVVIDGITFRIPEAINNNWNARCYCTDLPCLYKIDPKLKTRGKNISSGFRLKK